MVQAAKINSGRSVVVESSTSSSVSSVSTNHRILEGDDDGDAGDEEEEEVNDNQSNQSNQSNQNNQSNQSNQSKQAVPQDPNTPIHDKDNHQPILFNRKQLVLFAGPHNSASTSVEEFMAQWAESGWKRGHPHTKACVRIYM
ncbi:unnamed protein product [Cylindrotheca closterium]|uniref:Uncharacterized protein n=1 Tax=Cylindrotheca closterium TaxID=2856 RepID=A0AAD2G210_9STRA|nr:unnamed protein product [Cylindrotheca closterium]